MDFIFELLLELIASIFGVVMGNRLRFVIIGFFLMLILLACYLAWKSLISPTCG